MTGSFAFRAVFSRPTYGRSGSGALRPATQARAVGTERLGARPQARTVMTNHPDFNQRYRCVTCEIEIEGVPTFSDGLPFCCAGCAAGGPCICSYDGDAGAGSRVRHCLDVEAVFAPGARSRAREAVLASSH